MRSIIEWFRRLYKEHPTTIKMILIGGVLFFIMYRVRLNNLESTPDEPEEVEFVDFMELVENGDIDTIYYNTNDEYITYTLYNEETREMPKAERDKYEYPDDAYRRTLNPKNEGFRREMLEYGITMTYKQNQSLMDIFSNLFSAAISILWIILIFKMVTGVSKSLKEDDVLQKSDVKFSDVIGQDEILEDIKFISKLIKEPKMGDNMGIKTPKGILLTGDPGVGKTMIAKAIAGESDVPFISMSGSDFRELYVGVGAKRVRELFKIARNNSPCIVFIDEIDSVGANRDDRHSSNSEDNQTINALLKEMDGFTGLEGVFVLAATNHPEKLDSALKRSGRFDREIHINPPRDYRVRKKLLEKYFGESKLAEDVDLENLARQISGFTGADIAMICNESGIIAMMKEKAFIDNDCIEEAIDKKVFNGSRSKSEQYKEDKIRVAYHEAGHAVMTWLCKENISRVSIIGTTSGVGGAVFHEDHDSHFETAEMLRNHVKIAYAGRASEEIKYKGNVSTGATNDISQATNILLQYVERYGFDDEFGLIDVSILTCEFYVNSKVIMSKVSQLSKEIYAVCLADLQANFKLIELLAERLLTVDTISGKEVVELLENAQ